MTAAEDRLAFSPVAIPQCRFEDAFPVAATAGFKGIALRYNLLEDYLARGNTLAGVRALQQRHGLGLTEGGFLAEWQFNGGVPLICKRRRQGGADETKDTLLKALRVFMERCSELGCVNITAAPALYKTGDLKIAAEELDRKSVV